MRSSELLKFLVSLTVVEDRAPHGALPANELRFVMEFSVSPDIEALRTQITGFLENDGFVLQPLFESEEEDLARFLVLRFPGVDNSLPRDDLMELAYELQRQLDLASCEPDLGARVFVDPEPTGPERKAEVADVLGGLCWVDRPAPGDKLWALNNTRVPAAWALSPGKGDGIIIAQPDTGVASHPELNQAALRLDLAHDIVDGDSDPSDPLDPSTANPGHGTSTASVAISGQDGAIAGSAPGAKLVPIRCIEDVKVFDASPVAAAVEHARSRGCHVVTMSLGGVPSRALRKAIKRAVADDIIVLAAAGNCVKKVVWPARYDDVIAVGGTNVDDKAWKGSCRGPDVDFAAPAELVWRAKHDIENGGGAIVSGGQGTSFAVALTAGIAALWLSHHGRDALIGIARDKNTNVQELFRAAARETARKPAGWDSDELGAGIVDAEALLRHPPEDIAVGRSSGGGLFALLGDALGVTPEVPVDELGRFETEIAGLLLDDARLGRFSGVPGAEAISGPVAASATLRQALESSTDPALRLLAQRVANPGAGIHRVRLYADEVNSITIVGRSPGSGLESSATLSVEAARRNLQGTGIRDRLDVVERKLAAISEQEQDEDAEADVLRKDVVATGERALTKLRDQGAGAVLDRGERVALEALVKLTGRPAVRIEDGTVDVNNPQLGEWQGPVVLHLDQVEKVQASVGRVDLGGRHMGTGFVAGPGLVMTNRHVLETIATPLPRRKDPSHWLLSDRGATINFSSSGREDDQSFKIKSVVFAGPNPILHEPIDFEDLDMALLEVETSNSAGTVLPGPLDILSDPGAARGNGQLFVFGYPAAPHVLPTDMSGNPRMDVIKRLRAIFGTRYSVKYLSAGVINKPVGNVSGDPRNWTFAHDATTLGGNSGSCIFRISDGHFGVAGLHFAGDWMRANFAHGIGAVIGSGDLTGANLARLHQV